MCSSDLTRLIPLERSAEFFGFYNMIGKFAAVLGPLTVGGVTLLVHSLGAESTIAARVGIASIIIFFLAGGGIFLASKDRRSNKDQKNGESGSQA